MHHRLFILATVLYLSLQSSASAELYPYKPAKTSGGELRYVNGLPVLMLTGSPEEIGTQLGTLTKDVLPTLMQYPEQLATALGRPRVFPFVVEACQQFRPRFPADHMKELQAGVKTVNLDMKVAVAANVLPDVYRAFGCSSLMIGPAQSATGGLLFGRNLDFYTLGTLHKYSMVMVYRPTGKHAFASIGFPGLVGSLSGMNDQGLALAVHEVYRSKDGSPMLDPTGVPYTMCFRRILEECKTVEEAITLLQNTKRTTMLNLAVADKNSSAVIELTPKSVVVRRGNDGRCACTNHFRTEELAKSKFCLRYDRLNRPETEKVTIERMAEHLHSVQQGKFTLQTMIFEPATLRLHLAIGQIPSSEGPLKAIDLKPLFTEQLAPVVNVVPTKRPQPKSDQKGPAKKLRKLAPLKSRQTP